MFNLRLVMFVPLNFCGSGTQGTGYEARIESHLPGSFAIMSLGE